MKSFQRTFQALKALNNFRGQHLPYLRTIEDIELLHEIGLHQAAGRPLTLKTLFLQGIGTVATVQRRLSRLKRLGVVQQTRADHDRRLVNLTVTPEVWAVYSRMGRMMRKAWA